MQSLLKKKGGKTNRGKIENKNGKEENVFLNNALIEIPKKKKKEKLF